MEYEPHFIGEETKTTEGHGEQVRLIPKAEGATVSCCLCALPSGALSHCHMRGPLSTAAQLLAHPGREETDRQCPTVTSRVDTAAPPGHAPEAQGKQAH